MPFYLSTDYLSFSLSHSLSPVGIRQEVNEVGRGLAARLEKLRPLLGGGYVYTAGKVGVHDYDHDT